jgi:hypothetical protein
MGVEILEKKHRRIWACFFSQAMLRGASGSAARS